MGCAVRRLAGGGFVTVRTSGRAKPKQCYVEGCGAAAIYLCDFPRCDKPICDRHATSKGKGVDVCPRHADG